MKRDGFASLTPHEAAALIAAARVLIQTIEHQANPDALRDLHFLQSGYEKLLKAYLKPPKETR
jgi:hypothetical protein